MFKEEMGYYWIHKVTIGTAYVCFNFLHIERSMKKKYIYVDIKKNIDIKYSTIIMYNTVLLY